MKTIVVYYILSFSVLSMFLVGLTSTIPKPSDRRLEEFIQRMEAWDGTEIKFNHPDSPLYPYRHRHLDEGLSQQKRAAGFRFQESGDCFGKLQDYAVEGFFGLYPFLKPILKHENLGQRLTTSIQWYQTAMWERCIYFQNLKKFRSRFDVGAVEPVDGSPVNPWPNLNAPIPARITARQEWQFVALSLGTLAFCRSYPPSIKEVLATAFQHGGLAFSTEEAVYLTARASNHGILSMAEVEAAKEEFQLRGMLLSDINTLLREARFRPMHQMRYLRGHWQKVCGHWFETEKAR
ncbi:MAG: hypothetical protein GKR97_18750 [Rhizobiaceae bacterium]|nr:hypothetical protein [Rhizobiaceae bacterium]